eukprot:TRINITY_DN17934_c0_g1_i1.p1 TRINITY_DN17934_c0_g1~~TRINITY_DN17934_c0_g1_i1.p1  ORF type:complete len:379 (+),score=88.66 TRINITY_DN17934_c0_g1_i1:130-1137(+)
MPMWLAPNLITLFGGLAVVAATTACCLWSPQAASDLPSWVFVAVVALLYTYQTADNIDGKQAKRTGAGSPLGELFDHGVDAFVMGMMATICAILVKGPVQPTIAVVIFALGPFWLAHWEEYYAGTLILGAFTGPTELQHAFCAFVLFTMAMGQDFFHTEVFGVEMLHLFAIAALAGVVFMTLMSAHSVYQLISTKTSVKNGATMGKALLQLVPWFVFYSLCTLWVTAPAVTPVIVASPYLFYVTVIVLFAYITQRLLVQRICKESIQLLYPIYVPLALVAVHARHPFGGVSVEQAAWALLGLVTIQETVFLLSIISQLTSFLGIRAFVIVKKKSA